MKIHVIIILSFVASAFELTHGQCLVSTDDHGNGPSAATVLAIGSALNGEIEVDRDRDYFCFDVTPYAEYTVVVTPQGGTPVDEAEVALIESDGKTRLEKRSSINQPNAQIVYLNRSVARRIYIDVRSFAEYSKGDYQVTLNMTAAPVDSDGDDLPDQWEIDHQLNPGSSAGIHGAAGDPDGDGLSNLDEFRSITDPRDASSKLVVAGTLPQPSGIVSWQATPFATYRIFRSSTIVSPVWTPLAVVTHAINSPIAEYVDTAVGSAGQMYFYRVEMIP